MHRDAELFGDCTHAEERRTAPITFDAGAGHVPPLPPSSAEKWMTGIVVAALLFAVDVAVLIGLLYAMMKWRRPLWLRWLSGTTLYLLYAGIVSRFVPAIWSGMIVVIAAYFANVTLFSAQARPSDWWVIFGRAWVTLSLVPAVILGAAALGVRVARRPHSR
jgi:hypothetical protein